MILSITPNPSLDLLFEAEHLVWDDANRMAAPRVRPGGQGINLTRVARALGGPSLAVALLGGRTGTEIERMLAVEGTPCERIDMPAQTRVFVGVRETGTGRSMLLNPRGATIGGEDCDRVVSAMLSAIARVRPRWVTACGSIPPGLPEDLYYQIGQAAHRAGARFVPDCDGSALRLAAPAADLLVPNLHEAERLLDTRIPDVAAAARAAPMLLATGATTAAITLGADGAVLADDHQVWHARTPPSAGGSAVGAGDAFLAALLIELERGSSLELVLRRAVAAGAAVLESTGTDLLTMDALQRIEPTVELQRLV